MPDVECTVFSFMLAKKITNFSDFNDQITIVLKEFIGLDKSNTTRINRYLIGNTDNNDLELVIKCKPEVSFNFSLEKKEKILKEMKLVVLNYLSCNEIDFKISISFKDSSILLN